MTNEPRPTLTLIANERENYNNTEKMLEAQRVHTLQEMAADLTYLCNQPSAKGWSQGFRFGVKASRARILDRMRELGIEETGV